MEMEKVPGGLNSGCLNLEHLHGRSWQINCEPLMDKRVSRWDMKHAALKLESLFHWPS